MSFLTTTTAIGVREPTQRLDRVHVGPVAVAGLDGVPFAGVVPEPPPPLGNVRAVLSVTRPVFGLDERKH